MEKRTPDERYKQLIQKIVVLEAKYRRDAVLARQVGLIQQSDTARKRANTLAVRLAVLDKLYTQKQIVLKR